MENKIVSNEEFTTDEQPEVKEEEKETLSGSSPDENQEEQPASTGEETPGVEVPEETEEAEEPSVDTEQGVEPLIVKKEELEKQIQELERQTQGLEGERLRKLREVQELRTEKRDIVPTKEEIKDVEDEVLLEGVNPDDVKLIEKVLKAKGYVRKEDAAKLAEEKVQGITYEQSQKAYMQDFLNKHPEYKPENDPGDVMWRKLQDELSLYAVPQDATKIPTILERAHGSIAPTPVGGEKPEVIKKRLETAGLGAGQGKKSSPSTSPALTPQQVEEYRRGGWSEEEIKKMQNSS